MNEIKLWLEDIGLNDWTIEEVSADASFRNYYRIKHENESYIIMDASLAKESIAPFIKINEQLRIISVPVPKIIEQDLEKGYLILEDFGEIHLFDVLDETNFQTLYQKSIDEIVKMQQSFTTDLPAYDEEFLLFEMNLMPEWYLEKHLQKSPDLAQKIILKKVFNKIIEVVLEQPNGVFVHRDYHSKNIMITRTSQLGILDFQDARSGAITYDLVSLLKDCYIEWDTKEIEKLALYYRDSIWLDTDDATFIKWFDYMGLQRHLKILGIFARLSIRDNKEGYLEHIPLTLKYVIQTASKYEELKDLVTLLETL